DVAAAELGMRREPRCRRLPDAPHLLRVHHLERIAVAVARFALHLAEDERAAPAHDQIELVAADPDVRAEDAVAAQAVVLTRFKLARVPHSSARARSGGGSEMGRACARLPSAPA